MGQGQQEHERDKLLTILQDLKRKGHFFFILFSSQRDVEDNECHDFGRKKRLSTRVIFMKQGR